MKIYGFLLVLLIGSPAAAQLGPPQPPDPPEYLKLSICSATGKPMAPVLVKEWRAIAGLQGLGVQTKPLEIGPQEGVVTLTFYGYMAVVSENRPDRWLFIPIAHEMTIEAGENKLAFIVSGNYVIFRDVVLKDITLEVEYSHQETDQTKPRTFELAIAKQEKLEIALLALLDRNGQLPLHKSMKRPLNQHQRLWVMPPSTPTGLATVKVGQNGKLKQVWEVREKRAWMLLHDVALLPRMQKPQPIPAQQSSLLKGA